MLETGARAGETVALLVADVDLQAGTAIVRRGKGGKGRIVPFGPFNQPQHRPYMRLRRSHRLAAAPALWLGDRGRRSATTGYTGRSSYRAALAGIPDFHAHRLRHTAAHRWLPRAAPRAG